MMHEVQRGLPVPAGDFGMKGNHVSFHAQLILQLAVELQAWAQLKQRPTAPASCLAAVLLPKRLWRIHDQSEATGAIEL